MKFYGLHEFPQKLQAYDSTSTYKQCEKTLRLPLIPPIDFTGTGLFGFTQFEYDAILYKDAYRRNVEVISKYNLDYVTSAIFSEQLYSIQTNSYISTKSDITNESDITFYDQYIDKYLAKDAIFSFEIIQGNNSSNILDTTEAATLVDSTVILDSTFTSNTLGLPITAVESAFNRLLQILPQYSTYNIPVEIRISDISTGKSIFRIPIDTINNVSFNQISIDKIDVTLLNTNDNHTNYTQLDDYLNALTDYTIGQIVDITTDVLVEITIFTSDFKVDFTSETEKIEQYKENFNVIPHTHDINTLEGLLFNQPGGLLKLHDTLQLLEISQKQKIQNLESIVDNYTNVENILLFSSYLEKIKGNNQWDVQSLETRIVERLYNIQTTPYYTSTDVTIGGVVYNYKYFDYFEIKIDQNLEISFDEKFNFSQSSIYTENDSTNYETKYQLLGIKFDLNSFNPQIASKQIDKTTYSDSTVIDFIEIIINDNSTLKSVNNSVIFQFKGYEFTLVQPTLESVPNITITQIFDYFDELKNNIIELKTPKISAIPPGSITKEYYQVNYNYIKYISGLSAGNTLSVSTIYNNPLNIKNMFGTKSSSILWILDNTSIDYNAIAGHNYIGLTLLIAEPNPVIVVFY